MATRLAWGLPHMFVVQEASHTISHPPHLSQEQFCISLTTLPEDSCIFLS